MEGLRAFVRNIRETIPTYNQNDKTWIMYEITNEFNDEQLQEEFNADIVDVAVIINDEVITNPSRRNKKSEG